MKKPLTHLVLMIAIVLMVGLTYCDGSSTDTSITPSESLNKENDKMPTIVGGIMAIAEKVHYPEIAKRAGIEGKVFVKAVLDTDGSIISAEVVKGIGAGCDEAALKAINETQFTPGYKDGEPVKTEITIPVKFKLKDAKSKTESAAIYKVTDEMASVVGSVASIAQKVVYPDLAKRAGIEGKVIVQAVIDESGSVVSTEVLESVGSGCDEAAVKAITQTKFKPGIKDGKAVKSEVTIPVKFKLDGEKTKKE